jgi:hypothetical protein
MKTDKILHFIDFLVLALFFVKLRLISKVEFIYFSILISSFYEQNQIFLCHCCTEAAIGLKN